MSSQFVYHLIWIEIKVIMSIFWRTLCIFGVWYILDTHLWIIECPVKRRNLPFGNSCWYSIYLFLYCLKCFTKAQTFLYILHWTNILFYFKSKLKNRIFFSIYYLYISSLESGVFTIYEICLNYNFKKRKKNRIGGDKSTCRCVQSMGW